MASCQSCKGCCAPPANSAPAVAAPKAEDHKLTMVTVPDPSDFDTVLASHAEKVKANGNLKLLVLVTGAVDPATGKSWCPDCVQAEPTIMKVLGPMSDVILLTCPVERSKYKGNPDYPYRKHRQLQLKAVPTLYLWGKNGPLRSLVEEQLFNAESIEALLEP